MSIRVNVGPMPIVQMASYVLSGVVSIPWNVALIEIVSPGKYALTVSVRKMSNVVPIENSAIDRGKA